MDVDRILLAESGGDPLARNPRSTATGAGQFIESTWIDTLAKHRPDIIQGRSRADILALRNDPDLSKAMTAAYGADNASFLGKAGVPVNPGSIYLAHFAGPQGAVDLLRANPDAPVASVMTPAAMKANPFLSGMNVAGLRAWADRKMGGAPVSGGVPAIAAPASDAAAPMDAFGSLAGGAAPAAEPSGDADLSTLMSAVPQQQKPSPMAMPQMQMPATRIPPEVMRQRMLAAALQGMRNA